MRENKQFIILELIKETCGSEFVNSRENPFFHLVTYCAIWDIKIRVYYRSTKMVLFMYKCSVDRCECGI